MDALNRTKRITIGAFTVVVVLIIALISYKKPLYHYQLSPQEMNDELALIYQVTPDEAMELMYDSSTVFVDTRSIYDYEVDHLENAINIPVANLLDRNNKKMFDKWQQDSIQVVLYGNDELQADAPWMLLYQLGYTNTRTLMGGMSYFDKLYNDKLANNETYNVESPAYNYADIIKAGSNNNSVSTGQQPAKKVTVRKRKKKEAEGGC